METQILEFVSAHGTVVVLATTLLAAIGIVQWRKVHVAELDLALLEKLLEQGLAVEEIETLLRPKAAPRTGMLKQLGDLVDNALKQFGALSDDARWTLMLPVLMAVMLALTPLTALLHQSNRNPESRVNRMHVGQPLANQPSAPHDGQAEGFALTPERPIVFLDEADAGSCRVYLSDGYPVYDLQMVAAVSGQDSAAGELRVEATPGVVPRAEGSNGRRYCDVRLQAVRGAGHFTVQVTVADKYRQRAQTTFSVHVGTSQQMAPSADRGDAPPDGWL